MISLEAEEIFSKLNATVADLQARNKALEEEKAAYRLELNSLKQQQQRHSYAARLLLLQCLASAQLVQLLEKEMMALAQRYADFFLPCIFCFSLSSVLFVLPLFLSRYTSMRFDPWDNGAWGRSVRDLYAELYVSCGLSQKKVPEVVARVLHAASQDPDLPRESLVSRALFERLNVYLLYLALTLSQLGPDDFVGVCAFSRFCVF